MKKQAGRRSEKRGINRRGERPEKAERRRRHQSIVWKCHFTLNAGGKGKDISYGAVPAVNTGIKVCDDANVHWVAN